MTTKLQGPFSPQEAEVIAGMLKEAAANWRFQFGSAQIPEGLADRLDDMATAIRAAAREPLGEAWVVMRPDGRLPSELVGRDVARDYAESHGDGYRAVRVAIVPVDTPA